MSRHAFSPEHRSAARSATRAILRTAAAAALLTLSVAGRGGAQAAPRQRAPVSTVRQGDWMLSVNPLGLLYGGLTGEVERKLTGSKTFGVAVNYWGGYGGWSYLSADAKLRFYHRSGATKVLITNTDAADFEGLSFGPTVGFQRVSYDACAAILNDGCSATGITAGGVVDYGVRFGKEKQFSGLAGVGLKTGFGFSNLAGGFTTTYPTLRLAVGYVLGKPR